MSDGEDILNELHRGERSMPRIAMVNPDTVTPRDLVDAIRERRGGRLQNIDLMLLRNTRFAEGFNYFAPRVRFDTPVRRDLLELAICLVGLLNGAQYEYHHHLKVWKAEGADDEKVKALGAVARGEAVDRFSPEETAVISLAQEMTRDVRVSDATFNRLGDFFDEEEIFGLVANIAFYNMVSRLLVALGVELEPDA